ncbi:MAG: 16S rRNA (cytidine(1402)-2'-O)-methyltransferase [Bacteroidota bacterium]|nr:16S rRNA (cytidine(1402)-2'-O)-methyltransferase [Bacteroidota bacterium]
MVVQRGTLYIVSTPIGNLEDISRRAINILSEVDLIAAEDTRTTKILLDHYKVRKALISYFSYNETKRIPELTSKLKSGTSIALVSEGGTPGISDPASRMINVAISENIPVVAIPGPVAFLPALIISGLPTERFLFVGFLPIKKGRKSYLQQLSHETKTVILYESPHRLLKTLLEVKQFFGNRNISVSRELTKMYEQTIRGKISVVINYFRQHPIRGEFVLIVEGASGRKSSR